MATKTACLFTTPEELGRLIESAGWARQAGAKNHPAFVSPSGIRITTPSGPSDSRWPSLWMRSTRRRAMEEDNEELRALLAHIENPGAAKAAKREERMVKTATLPASQPVTVVGLPNDDIHPAPADTTKAFGLRAGGGLHIQVFRISPDVAARWVGLQAPNRNRSARHMETLAGALNSGEWVLNGDAIRFDKTGRLVDGQHRLTVCAETGVPLVSVVMWGLEPVRAQETIDQGKKRSFAEQLKIRGFTYQNELQAVLTACFFMRSGEYNRSEKPRFSHLFEQLEKNIRVYAGNDTKWKLNMAPPEPEQMRQIMAWSKGPEKLSPAVVGYCWLKFSEVADEEHATRFFDLLNSRDPRDWGGAKSPIFLLRETVRKRQARSEINRPDQREWIALTIKAWNRWIRHEEISLLRYAGYGIRPEAFPVPIGLE